jgi:outer membrane receptor protein involved in Fe transport
MLKIIQLPKWIHRLIFICFLGGASMGEPNTQATYITGTIIDSTDLSPLEYASISVINSGSNYKIMVGGISDEKGAFSIRHTLVGHYTIEIEYIGYETKTFPGLRFSDEENHTIDVPLGKFNLLPKVLKLEKVDAVGFKSPLRVGLDKKIFTITKSESILNQSAEVALRKIPSVDVDIDGVISINGDQNITVLINGLRLSGTHGEKNPYLDLITTGFIEKIDVITNPSVAMDPNGMGGIINIILKDDIVDGFHSSTSLTYGNHNRYNGLLRLSYKKRKMEFELTGFGKSDFSALNSEREYEWQYDSFSLGSIQKKSTTGNPLTGGINLGSTLNFSDRNILHLGSFFTVFNHSSRDSIRHKLPVEYHMTSSDNKRGWNLDASIIHALKFSDDNSLTTTAAFAQSGEHQKEINDRNSNGAGPDDHSHIYQDDAIETKEFESVYKTQSPRFGMIQGGTSYQSLAINSELEYLHAPYGFDFNEQVSSGYFRVHKSLKATLSSLSAGIRIEQRKTSTGVYDIELSDSHQHSDTSNVFVSLIDSSIANSSPAQKVLYLYPELKTGFTSMDEKLSIIMKYGRRINRVKLAMVNPFPVSMIDEYHVRKGNPFLKPELVDIYQINFSFRLNTKQHPMLTGNIFYKDIQDLIQWYDVDFVTINEQSFEILTAGNVAIGKSVGYDFALSISPTKNIRLILDYNNWIKKTSGEGETDLIGNSSGSITDAQIRIAMPWKVDFELWYRRYGKHKLPIGEIAPYYYVDLSLGKAIIDKNVYLTFSVHDMFNSRIMDIYTEQAITNPTSGVTYIQKLNATKYNEQRLISLGVQFNLSAFPTLGQSKRNRINKPDHPDDIDVDY